LACAISRRPEHPRAQQFLADIRTTFRQRCLRPYSVSHYRKPIFFVLRTRPRFYRERLAQCIAALPLALNE
jgi:hypothetical protein